MHVGPDEPRRDDQDRAGHEVLARADEVDVRVVEHLHHRQLLEPALAVPEVEDEPADVNGREEVDQDADDEGQGEPLHLLRADRVKHDAREHDGDVRVEDRHPRSTEAGADLLRHARALLTLLAHPLEDEDVGIDGHADREGQPREPRQSERRLHQRHRPDEQDHVQDQADDRDQPRESVVDEHEDRHDQHRDLDRQQPLVDRVLAERRADLLFEQGDRVDRGGQAAGAEDGDQPLHLAVGHVLDDALIGDLGADDGGRHQLVVEQDGQMALERSRLRRAGFRA